MVRTNTLYLHPRLHFIFWWRHDFLLFFDGYLSLDLRFSLSNSTIELAFGLYFLLLNWFQDFNIQITTRFHQSNQFQVLTIKLVSLLIKFIHLLEEPINFVENYYQKSHWNCSLLYQLIWRWIGPNDWESYLIQKCSQWKFSFFIQYL